MIESEFLAQLRRQHRAEMVLVLVQLEQICPGWWESLEDLAAELGTDRATLNRSLRHLEDRGLIQRCSISNKSGTWIWWVKRHAADAPQPEEEPAWILRSMKTRCLNRVPISQRRHWAEQRGIPLPTLIGFLNGHQKTLVRQWQLIGTPFDEVAIQ